jgi:hypothetical protein
MKHNNAFVIAKGEKQLKVGQDNIKQKYLYISGMQESRRSKLPNHLGHYCRFANSAQTTNFNLASDLG